MLWYWIIVGIRWVVWFVKPPKPEALAKANPNQRCPVCGWKSGRIRCVQKVKAGPQNPNALPVICILRQHTCNICGARQFLEPILKSVSPSTVLPSVARNDIEVKEDRQANLLAQETPKQ
jgi:hypothetical protein